MRILPTLIVTLGVAAVLAAIALSSGEPGHEPRMARANAASGVAAGDYHGCALSEGASVQCWGWNPYGQLGEGRTCGFACAYPVVTTGLDDATAIVAGGYHTCALRVDASASCWGANASGQLGAGDLVQRETPADVIDLGGITELAAGYNHTCALTKTGGVHCWGNNNYGEVGDGTFATRTAPTAVAGLGAGAASVAAGGFSSCAVLLTGGVRCWGYNSLGQLGDGTTQDRSQPVAVAGIDDATAVTVGAAHACALTVGGGVECWGNNDSGQLGDGTIEDRHTPVAVGGLGGSAVRIAAGGYYTCAVLSDATVRCWGDNSWSQLGGEQPCSEQCLSPVSVPGLTGVDAIAAGLRHACASSASGDVACWGANDTGQLAIGVRHPNANPPFHPPEPVDLKAPITVTPPLFPTSTPTSTPLPGVTPGPTPSPPGTCGEIPDSITNGPRVGMTTDEGATIWARSCRPAMITLQYKSPGTEWSSATTIGPQSTDPNADHTILLPVSGLQPDAEYDYRLLINGQTPQFPLEGRFRTMPPEGEEAAFSFFIGTDMHLPQFPMAAILNSIEQHNPLFGVLGGDSILVEQFQVPPVSRAAYEKSYRDSLSNTEFRQFEASMPLGFIWSDHEVYNDWDHRTSPPYLYARLAFDEYLGAANPAPRDAAGIHYTFKAADIEFYVLDQRTFRSPGERPDGPAKTMLGTAQKQDLKNWLMTSEARFKLIVSDVWWNDFSGHAIYGESWPAYSSERTELLDFIVDSGIPGVVLISGDEHMTGVFRLAPWGIYEITPGPMSWTPGQIDSNDPQILFSSDNERVFGIFEVDTTACPATLEVTLHNETNESLYTLPLTERDLGADADGNGLVPCEEQTEPTPTSLPPTPTSTPTGLPGDASCDGVINSIDAALILQRTAGLLGSLPCSQNADVNGDGRADSIDASLVLQHAAGLLQEL